MWSPLSGSRQQDLLTNSHHLLLECCSRRFWWPERDLSKEWGGGKVIGSWTLGQHPWKWSMPQRYGVTTSATHNVLTLSYNHDGKADWTREMWPQVLGIKEFLNPNNKALLQDYLLIERKEKLLFIRPLFVGSNAFLMLFGVLLRDA